MKNALPAAVLEPLSTQAIDLALRLRPVRKWAVDRAEKMLYDFYCVKRFEGLPLGVQEARHKAVMNLIRVFEKAITDGRVSPRARRGIIDAFFIKTVANARKNVASFITRHNYEPPTTVVISPTQRCNLYCKGCYSASSAKTPGTLAYDTFCRVIEDKRDDWGSHFTVITGGEPLMYASQGKTIFDVFERFQDNYFMMYTNATLLDEAVAERLAELGNVTPAISVEGFEKETDARRGKGVWKKIERAMDALRKVGVPFGISMTATRENADVLMSDDIITHYMDTKGAIYAWLFQYMPIGRGSALDLMVTPEQRKRMLDRELELVEKRGHFFMDFWNSGHISGGCISAGKAGGFFHIDWNGDVSPCVFVPYAVDNVYDIYRSHRTLGSVLEQPVLKEMRDWQEQYAGRTGDAGCQNMFRPCPMRDHHQVVHDILIKHGAKPMNPEAALALEDQKYLEGMQAYSKQIADMLDPIWQAGVGAREPWDKPVQAAKPAADQENSVKRLPVLPVANSN